MIRRTSVTNFTRANLTLLGPTPPEDDGPAAQMRRFGRDPRKHGSDSDPRQHAGHGYPSQRWRQAARTAAGCRGASRALTDPGAPGPDSDSQEAALMVRLATDSDVPAPLDSAGPRQRRRCGSLRGPAPRANPRARRAVRVRDPGPRLAGPLSPTVPPPLPGGAAPSAGQQARPNPSLRVPVGLPSRTRSALRGSDLWGQNRRPAPSASARRRVLCACARPRESAGRVPSLARAAENDRPPATAATAARGGGDLNLCASAALCGASDSLEYLRILGI